MGDELNPSPWASLESIPSQTAVAAAWRRVCGEFYAAFRLGCLALRSEPATLYPCPQGSGYPHTICHHDDGSIVAVPENEDRGCGEVPLRREDIAVWELSWPKLGHALCQALNLSSRPPAELGLYNTRQIGCWPAAAVPVFATIQGEPLDFRHAVEGLIAHFPGRFILLSPTSRLVDAISTSLLASARAGLFSLETTLQFTEQGRLASRQAPGELFRAFTPEPTEPTDADTARKAYALVKTFNPGKKMKNPSLMDVFEDYCEGHSAARIAHDRSCCNLTVLRRLKLIRARTGMDPKDLRRFLPHFERIREELADSRAAHIQGRRLIETGG